MRTVLRPEWSDQVLNLKFKPNVVAAVTGYSAARQRKWNERYFHQMRLHYIFRGAPGEHRVLNWIELQALKVFGDVLTDLGSVDSAIAATILAGREGDETTPSVVRAPLSLQRIDRRGSEASPANDLFLISDLSRQNPWFSTLGGSTLPGACWPRCYIYNFSHMQRHLIHGLNGLGLWPSGA